jgi:hypothetical protein
MNARCAAFAGDPGDQRLELFLLVLAPANIRSANSSNIRTMKGRSAFPALMRSKSAIRIYKAISTICEFAFLL